MTRIINTIVIHCSDSPQGRGDNAATIHNWHKERGFDGIGYHYVILENGKRQAGRPEYWIGSHVKDHNANSIGICLIGKDSFTDEQNTELVALIRELLTRYPAANILGHYEFDSAKTCPNFNVPQWRAEHGLL